MDFFLIKDGVVQNIVAVDSLGGAQALYPDLQVVERTSANAYHEDGSPINPGDSMP